MLSQPLLYCWSREALPQLAAALISSGCCCWLLPTLPLLLKLPCRLAPAASTWYSAQHCMAAARGKSRKQRQQVEKRQQVELHAEAVFVLGV
jgi:hypothetical protein